MDPNLKVVTPSPENAETPLAEIHGWVTPTRLFFVRNHFDIPAIDRTGWRLSVEGCVRSPLELTWDDLNNMPQRTLLATLECAGNGRSFLSQRVAGVPWGAGAVAHGEWSGVPLAAVLEQAGLDAEAVEIVCVGADRGAEPDHPEPMHFARGLPLAKALHRDTLLVLRMNGEPLTPSHGAPVRLLVPGWYGVASVKWLTRLEAVRTPFRGYFQTVKYTVQRGRGQGTETVGIQGMAVKSEIVRPFAGEALGVGRQRVFGLAWAGDEAVARVELSTDGGQTWNEAELLGPFAPYSWTMWEFLWKVDRPASHLLLSRATSAGGRVQPQQHDPLLGGYMIHFSRAIPVRVESRSASAATWGDVETLRYDMNAFAESNARLPLDVDLEFSHGAGI
ncbi:MAG: sulfite oxidase [Planctomycetaceae bacterium]|nr:sulfite oxidase [Planctomycetaceae bacterium]